MNYIDRYSQQFSISQEDEEDEGVSTLSFDEERMGGFEDLPSINSSIDTGKNLTHVDKLALQFSTGAQYNENSSDVKRRMQRSREDYSITGSGLGGTSGFTQQNRQQEKDDDRNFLQKGFSGAKNVAGQGANFVGDRWQASQDKLSLLWNETTEESDMDWNTSFTVPRFAGKVALHSSAGIGNFLFSAPKTLSDSAKKRQRIDLMDDLRKQSSQNLLEASEMIESNSSYDYDSDTPVGQQIMDRDRIDEERQRLATLKEEGKITNEEFQSRHKYLQGQLQYSNALDTVSDISRGGQFDDIYAEADKGPLTTQEKIGYTLNSALDVSSFISLPLRGAGAGLKQGSKFIPNGKVIRSGKSAIKPLTREVGSNAPNWVKNTTKNMTGYGEVSGIPDNVTSNTFRNAMKTQATQSVLSGIPGGLASGLEQSSNVEDNEALKHYATYIGTDIAMSTAITLGLTGAGSLGKQFGKISSDGRKTEKTLQQDAEASHNDIVDKFKANNSSSLEIGGINFQDLSKGSNIMEYRSAIDDFARLEGNEVLGKIYAADTNVQERYKQGRKEFLDPIIARSKTEKVNLSDITAANDQMKQFVRGDGEGELKLHDVTPESLKPKIENLQTKIVNGKPLKQSDLNIHGNSKQYSNRKDVDLEFSDLDLFDVRYATNDGDVLEGTVKEDNLILDDGRRIELNPDQKQLVLDNFELSRREEKHGITRMRDGHIIPSNKQDEVLRIKDKYQKQLRRGKEKLNQKSNVSDDVMQRLHKKVKQDFSKEVQQITDLPHKFTPDELQETLDSNFIGKEFAFGLRKGVAEDYVNIEGQEFVELRMRDDNSLERLPVGDSFSFDNLNEVAIPQKDDVNKIPNGASLVKDGNNRFEFPEKVEMSHDLNVDEQVRNMLGKTPNSNVSEVNSISLEKFQRKLNQSEKRKVLSVDKLQNDTREKKKVDNVLENHPAKDFANDFNPEDEYDFEAFADYGYSDRETFQNDVISYKNYKRKSETLQSNINKYYTDLKNLEHQSLINRDKINEYKNNLYIQKNKKPDSDYGYPSSEEIEEGSLNPDKIIESDVISSKATEPRDLYDPLKNLDTEEHSKLSKMIFEARDNATNTENVAVDVDFDVDDRNTTISGISGRYTEDLEDAATYKPIVKKEQAKMASQFIKEDIDSAFRVARELDKVPKKYQDLLPEAVAAELANHMIAHPEKFTYSQVRDFINDFSLRQTKKGQAISLTTNLDSNNIFRTIQDIRSNRKKPILSKAKIHYTTTTNSFKQSDTPTEKPDLEASIYNEDDPFSGDPRGKQSRKPTDKELERGKQYRDQDLNSEQSPHIMKSPGSDESFTRPDLVDPTHVSNFDKIAVYKDENGEVQIDLDAEVKKMKKISYQSMSFDNDFISRSLDSVACDGNKSSCLNTSVVNKLKKKIPDLDDRASFFSDLSSKDQTKLINEISYTMTDNEIEQQFIRTAIRDNIVSSRKQSLNSSLVTDSDTVKQLTKKRSELWNMMHKDTPPAKIKEKRDEINLLEQKAVGDRDLLSNPDIMDEVNSAKSLDDLSDTVMQDLVYARHGMGITTEDVEFMRSLGAQIHKKKEYYESLRWSVDDTSDKGKQELKQARKDWGHDVSTLMNYKAALNTTSDFDLSRSTGHMHTAEIIAKGIGKGIGKNAKDLLWEFPKSIVTTLDVSQLGIQGAGSITRKEFWQNVPEIPKYLISEEAVEDIRADLISRDNFEAYTLNNSTGQNVGGLQLPIIKEVFASEDSLSSEIYKNLPVGKQVDRAYSAFLSKLRADRFDALYSQSQIIHEGNTPDKNIKEIIDTVNESTGTVTTQPNIGVLNDAFFSSRKFNASVNRLSLVPALKRNRVARDAAIQDLVGQSVVFLTLGALGASAGGEFILDTSSSDFGKIKFGNTRIDLTNGNGTFITFLSRLLEGELTSSTTGIDYSLTDDNAFNSRLDITNNFIRARLAPAMSLAFDLADGKDVTGQDVSPGSRVADNYTPLILQSLYDMNESDGAFVASLGFLTNLVGYSTASYGASENWIEEPNEEMSAYINEFGSDAVFDANQEYNRRINSEINKITQKQEYQDLENEDKKAVIRDIKATQKNEVLNSHGFTY